MSTDPKDNKGDIIIRRFDAGDAAATERFIIPMIREVYPDYPDSATRWDVTHLADAYACRPDAAMFLAIDRPNGEKVAGTAAINRYDDRIAAVRGIYDAAKTAELSRCYVDSRLRRCGIATRLVASLEAFSRSLGYAVICLHTHRFLPGGLPFWLSQGYIARLEPQDKDETVFMDKNIE
ncbi:GNAT family N-acetyltransferase [Acetonema longum]|uniref:GNAT family acetyltransferase n=1 Tax=Acetonema longum DSM 6540 TaxID=1009370 RepID=F7NFQ7_9FIRM|nr:GNAT family N-acetyltransferase [Acetonema longum]EGO65120.1 GNAT family acetyltransferase [Acetonema longum DSM 6540]